MILISGTKRSGTSMWMQIMEAAGLEIIGDKFPQDWQETIEEANPHGFYENRFRRGINFRTNPNPETGDYLHHQDAVNTVVKVFIPGIIRTDMAFINKVLVTMRSCRDYERSLTRLYTMEQDTKQKNQDRDLPMPVRTPPLLEWWHENFSIISDFVTRRYPLFMVAYDDVLQNTDTLLPEVFSWLGIGNADQALTAVNPPARKEKIEPSSSSSFDLPDKTIQVFDDFYGLVKNRQPLSMKFIEQLRATNKELLPLIKDAHAKVQEDRKRRGQAGGGFNEVIAETIGS